MEPEGALTVSDVMSNARGVVMVRWVRKSNLRITFLLHMARYKFYIVLYCIV